ncbi:MAG: STAS domain-containing protein [Planctomycetota bacterium]
MVERRKSTVVRTVGNIAVVYFVDSQILEEMQIKWLGNELQQLVQDQGRNQVVISFENVERFSTALLGKLIGMKKKAAEQQGDVKLCAIPPSIMEIFKVTGLDAAFDIFDDEMGAIKSFGPIG